MMNPLGAYAKFNLLFREIELNKIVETDERTVKAFLPVSKHELLTRLESQLFSNSLISHYIYRFSATFDFSPGGGAAHHFPLWSDLCKGAVCSECIPDEKRG